MSSPSIYVETFVHSSRRGQIVDFMGTYQHLAVDIDLAVAPNGGLRLFGRAQRFYEGPIAFPLPMLFSGRADVCEWYDDAESRYRIEVVVYNRTWGRLFGYTGWFEADFFDVKAEGVPAHVKPLGEERRE